MTLPLHIAKLDPVASFERCRLDIAQLTMTEISGDLLVMYGPDVVCRELCLTPEGMKLAGLLLPVDSDDRRHVAARWLTHVAASRK